MSQNADILEGKTMTPSEEDPEISTYFKIFTWLSATLFLAWVSYPIWKGWF